MEGSCIEESTSSSDSLFTAPSPLPSGKPPFPAVYGTPGSLCRMGSVASVVLDSENGVEAESRKIPSASKYKGVVPQPNGRWGAQIYEKHQRVWLGTFNEAYEAAKAYDIAAQRFRGLDAVTNFKPLSGDDRAEIKFLNSHSKAEIVDMLRKHTYTDELEQANRNSKLKGNGDMENNSNKCRFFDSVGFGMAREQLFEKVVTPSDVGRLNRLVIPKQHAEKHLPLQGGSNCSSKGLLLNFVDVNDKVWRFRYSYWNSSQSFVLTKGWSRFVKEKNLKAGDVVTFQRSTGPDKQLYIDRRSKNVPVVAGLSGQAVDPVGPGQVVIRLFGVDICMLPAVGNNGEGRRGKRMIDMEWSMECRNKKKMTVGAL